LFRGEGRGWGRGSGSGRLGRCHSGEAEKGDGKILHFEYGLKITEDGVKDEKLIRYSNPKRLRVSKENECDGCFVLQKDSGKEGRRD
jgi:hypothetical protein